MRSKKSIGIISILLIFMLSACNREKVFLRYDLQEGETYLLSMKSKQMIEQTVLNQTMAMNTSMDMTMKYKVAGITDSIYELQVSYTNMLMEMDLPQGKMQYNSETEDSTNVLSTVMKHLTEMSFTVKMKNTGKIVKIEGLTDLMEKLGSSLSGDQSQYKNQLEQIMQNYVGEDAVSRNFSMGVPVFPDEAVSKGEDWKLNSKLTSFLSGKLRTTYQLEELTSSEAVIIGDAFFNVEADSADLMMTGVELNYDINGPVESRYLFNLKNGWIEEGSINQKLSGTVSMPPSDEMPEGMTIEMSIESKISLRGEVE